jgi:flavin reductase (DIM6/NTAB) family NADH-FMN oxidoreductase RutF
LITEATQHFIDPSAISPQQCYQWMVGAVIPRPIAWVSTLSAEGIPNLAPFSFFTVASVAPPVLAFTQVNPRNRPEKDTLANLRATGECVVNVVSHALAAVMNQTCADYPPEIDEFQAAGIVAAPSKLVAPAGVAASPARFECRLREVLQFSDQPSGGQMILLDVVQIVVSEAALREGRLAPDLVDAVGKMAGDGYSMTRERFDMARPQWP